MLRTKQKWDANKENNKIRIYKHIKTGVQNVRVAAAGACARRPPHITSNKLISTPTVHTQAKGSCLFEITFLVYCLCVRRVSRPNTSLNSTIFRYKCVQKTQPMYHSGFITASTTLNR